MTGSALLAAAVSLAPVVYVGAWTAVPLLDKVALRRLSERTVLWGTFVLGAALTTAALAVMAARGGGLRKAAQEARTALSMPIMWAIGLATVTGYLAYFTMLSRVDVHKVVLLNPLVLCATLLSSVLILSEKIHGTKAVGVAIVLCGLVAFYWQDLTAAFGRGKAA